MMRLVKANYVGKRDAKNYGPERQNTISRYGSFFHPMIPLVGLMCKTFGRYRKENPAYFEQAEQTVIEWVKAL